MSESKTTLTVRNPSAQPARLEFFRHDGTPLVFTIEPHSEAELPREYAKCIHQVRFDSYGTGVIYGSLCPRLEVEGFDYHFAHGVK